MAIFKNLLGYEDKDLGPLTINGETYLTDRGFVPRYIVGQSFGGSCGPSSYNLKLANAVLAAREIFNKNLPALVQDEIAFCLQGSLKETREIYPLGEAYEEGDKAVALSKFTTGEIMKKADETLEGLDLRHYHGLFIAHPCHVQRVMDRAGEFGIKGRPFIRKDIEWPTNDLQPWVRSPLLFIPREIIARFLKK